MGPPDAGVWMLMCLWEHGAFVFPLGEGVPSLSVMPDSSAMKTSPLFLLLFSRVVTLDAYTQGCCVSLCSLYPAQRYHQRQSVVVKTSLDSTLQVKDPGMGMFTSQRWHLFLICSPTKDAFLKIPTRHLINQLHLCSFVFLFPLDNRIHVY